VDLLTDDDQWESLKDWLRRNGLALVGGVALGVLGLLGWRWWQEHREAQALEGGTRFEAIVAALDAGEADKGLAQLGELKSKFPKSAYIAPAELAIAKYHVAKNELDKAAERLKSVADSAVDEKLRPVARLRLARVQVSQGKPDDALATLGTGDAGPHQSAYAEARGDALYAKGDKAGALREYEVSRDALVGSGGSPAVITGSLLELKIADLRSELPPTPAAAPAPASAPAAAPAPAAPTPDTKG
jgi:predicted negative regulator of RcsB-dependent stress response